MCLPLVKINYFFPIVMKIKAVLLRAVQPKCRVSSVLMKNILQIIVYVLDGCSFHYGKYGVNKVFRFVQGIW